ncbi:Target of rapamycin complex subunit lst8 [Zancudomyces culisetae]|uniref:Target of rapamycin complex subunit lst8 n=1 Tax=Zancudomyces culisetae TaxID=1213189 RepID=A0A1R1PTU5_ZANCU|nr:Target of rapamycin complex subunit lst8 [Zancudomyces culisetae]|eukprot:OMH84415.1 Target of rapamycin complex subunit lst8 [Zancudomyces culisetae]
MGKHPILTLDGHLSAVTAVEFTSDMRYLATSSEDKTVRWWDLRTGTCKRILENNGIVNDLAIIPGPRHDLLVTCDQNGCVRVWSLRNSEIEHHVEPSGSEKGAIRGVAVSPDGKLLVAANNHGRCFVYRLVIRHEVYEAKAKRRPLTANEKYVDMELLTSFDAHRGCYITKVLFSGNGRYLVTCSSDKTAKVWTFGDYLGELSEGSSDSEQEGIEINRTPDSDTRTKFVEDLDPSDLANKSSGTRGGTSDGEDSKNLKISLFHTLQYHKAWVWDAAFSNDSGYLVTVSSDTTAALWDISLGQVIRELHGHEKGVLCVALNDATSNY